MRTAAAYLALYTTVAIHLGLGPASAQTINLVCGGKFHQYDPEGRTATVPPAATTVDLAKKLILTPVGQYRISKVEETKIYVAEERQDFSVWGTLDRLTGKMDIFWERLAERAKRRAGSPSKFAALLELQCSVSNRLF
jgi:hypothetical protein